MKRDKILKILFCLTLSFIIISICSKNSFLYSFNDWVDANAFFTVGKGWMNGLIPYKDLFEQKGPILYLIYGIGYLISNNTFIGIYILEVISFSIFNFICLKSLEMTMEKKYSFLIVIILSSIIGSSLFFVQGGSAEEFCLPFLAYSVYSFQKYIKSDFKYDRKSLLINGLIAGIITLIKFNLLGFWFIWMVLIFFKYIFSKNIKIAIRSCFDFLIGMFIPILITILYFILNNAFNQFVEGYILFNLKAYASTTTLFNRINDLILNFDYHMRSNIIVFYLIVFGFIYIIFNKNKFNNQLFKLFIILSFFTLGLGIYIGGSIYKYYFLLNEYYIIFGLSATFILIKKFVIKEDFKNIKYILLVMISIIFCIFLLVQSPNLKYINLDKNYYAQYTFASIIKQTDNARILNYHDLDGGFYTAADIIPTTKYFMEQNVIYQRYPKILDEQNKIIKNKEVDYIIVKEYSKEPSTIKSNHYLNINYILIKKHTQVYEDNEVTYFLYEKR